MIHPTITREVYEEGAHRHEFDLYEFDLDGRLVRARRYLEQPEDTITVLGMLDPGKPGIPFSLYDVREARLIVAELERRGFKNIMVLDRQGCTPLDHSRLDVTQ